MDKKIQCVDESALEELVVFSFSYFWTEPGCFPLLWVFALSLLLPCFSLIITRHIRECYLSFLCDLDMTLSSYSVREVCTQVFTVSTVLVRGLKVLSHAVLLARPSGFTYSHLSIGTATDTVWGQQTEWGGEWGRGGYGTVCSVCVSSPICWSANQEVGLGWWVTALCPLWSWTQPLMHCLSQHPPPRFGLLCRPVPYILYNVHMLCLVCVLWWLPLERCAHCVAILSSQFQHLMHYHSRNSSSAETEMTLVIVWDASHWFGEGSTAFQTHQTPVELMSWKFFGLNFHEQELKYNSPNVSQGALFFCRLNWRSAPVTSSQFLVK